MTVAIIQTSVRTAFASREFSGSEIAVVAGSHASRSTEFVAPPAQDWYAVPVRRPLFVTGVASWGQVLSVTDH